MSSVGKSICRACGFPAHFGKCHRYQVWYRHGGRNYRSQFATDYLYNAKAFADRLVLVGSPTTTATRAWVVDRDDKRKVVYDKYAKRGERHARSMGYPTC